MSSSIHLKQIGHHFTLAKQQVSLFEGLNIELHSGQSYAIVGPSGVGKSSLLLLMAGLECPVSGEVQFQKNDDPQPLKNLRQSSGFIFQQFHLLPELDALSNVALPLKLKGDKCALATAELWLDKVGLSDRMYHKPQQLSGGEQQRVAIARAFAMQPQFIFADEPTGNLDEKTAQYIAQLMFDCCQQSGVGLVLVTHSMELAQQADTLLQLGQGKLTVKPGNHAAATVGALC
ncbi:ABC transporter ATP-binding protein [Microbulbifer agarilyticus]|uniref:ABC transporter ATP-binding protein n=1 Tax=Microbulbifer agarilyticus TaxID=260552 RepID=UPI001C96140D|nr:ABC transporter ATP-binding protein [Microbulbifer agarilyticus]MBY6211894.1 ABC transporter ATP-binding protein [Microbulbifer agarilyticus]